MRYLVVPQWQGSPSSRAMQLVDGALAIAGDLPADRTTRIEVPLEAGDSEGTGVHRFSSLRVVRQRIATALADDDDDTVVGIGGDCGISYPLVQRAADAATALVWFDAHGDANSPETSESKAFGGMALRSLVDDGIVPAERVVLVGARALDDAEPGWMRSAGVRSLSAEQADDPAALGAALGATGATRVYLHVDLDVLDPAELASVQMSEPFGLSLAALVGGIRAALAGRELAGATIAGFAPHSPEAIEEDLPTILRVLAALRPARG